MAQKTQLNIVVMTVFNGLVGMVSASALISALTLSQSCQALKLFVQRYQIDCVNMTTW